MRGSAILLGVCVALVSAAPAHALFGSKRRAAETRAEYAPTPYIAPAAPAADGAIFHTTSGYAPLTSGARAAQVGDILTILLVEKTQAVKSNSASTDRSSSLSLTPPITGPLSFLKKTSIDASGGGTFDGKGAAQQSNQLSGEISVTVAAVYPNGTMLVHGEKLLTLNRGDEHIRISGLVRTADIDFDNRVLSTRVADARITYAGTGPIARATKQGWLTHFFSILSPF
ncbi:MAG TPA: flagellar basal body L-ring protein FlgH [Sphingomonas sp.]|nr:flagellar basal body L-ring protein FlgH [Sphingomonas sp.]